MTSTLLIEQLALVHSQTKPTIKDGKWVFAPPPPQDAAWLRRASQTQPLPPLETPQ